MDVWSTDLMVFFSCCLHQMMAPVSYFLFEVKVRFFPCLDKGSFAVCVSFLLLCCGSYAMLKIFVL
jgi:hypothetical protein